MQSCYLVCPFTTDLDECASNEDDCVELCINTVGSFTCGTCDPGYVLNTAENSCDGKCRYEICSPHNYIIMYTQTSMSVQAMMVAVIMCVPTLKGALCVVVFLGS